MFSRLFVGVRVWHFARSESDVRALKWYLSCGFPMQTKNGTRFWKYVPSAAGRVTPLCSQPRPCINCYSAERDVSFSIFRPAFLCENDSIWINILHWSFQNFIILSRWHYFHSVYPRTQCCISFLTRLQRFTRFAAMHNGFTIFSIRFASNHQQCCNQTEFWGHRLHILTCYSRISESNWLLLMNSYNI